AGRRAGGAEGFNSRMGVGPIETYQAFGPELGLQEAMHTTAIHFDKGFELNGFGWVPNCWELCLHAGPNKISVSNLTAWLKEVRSHWPDVSVITQGEFGLLWRKHFKENSFNYRFEERGSGIDGSDANKEIKWFMNKHFRLALMRNWQRNAPWQVIDFTRYDIPAQEPQDMTRKWSLMGEINQKQTRPQDKPVPLKDLPNEYKEIITKTYPALFDQK
ncbi:MAG: DUF3863 domain-containing protein, partial [Tannerella sp.]|nr:DUF3863 domain-containing protein [Tannerella sp.]